MRKANTRAMLMASVAVSCLAGSNAAHAQTTPSTPTEAARTRGANGTQPSASNGSNVQDSATPAPSSNGAPAAGQENEIIVTAQKRSERLSDVPISINAISGDQLVKQGIVNTSDLQKIVPGFTFAPASTGVPIYTLRGIGFYANSNDVAPAVSVYIDQVPLPFPRMTAGSTLDLERVEVLKGPQGTLFGQNSTGGAINYIAGKPTSDFQGQVEGTYGRFNEADLGGFVSGPLTDNLSFRLAARSENQDGWQRNYVLPTTVASNSPNGVRHFINGRLTIDWKPTSDLKWEFTLSGWKDHSDDQANQKIGYAPLTPLDAGGFPGAPGYPDLQAQLQAYPNAPHSDTAAGFDPGVSLRRNDGFVQASARGDWQIAPRVTVTSISSYAHLSTEDPIDIDGTPYPDNYIIDTGRITTFVQELRAAGTALSDDRLKWVLGGNYEHDQTHEQFRTEDNGTNSGFAFGRFQNFDERNNQRISTEAIFGDADFTIVRNLTLQGAVRYTARQDHFTGCLADTGLPNSVAPVFGTLSSILTGTAVTIAPGSCVTLGPNNLPVNIIDDKLDEHNVSYRGGISWKATPELLVYANVTKGYKAGAFDTIPAIRTSQNAPVKQESVLAYEAGIKAFLFSHRVELDGAAFYYDYRDKQTEGFIDTGFPFGLLEALVNIPKSRVAGFELNGRVTPVTGLQLSGGVTYLSTKVLDDFTTPAPLGGAVDIKGASFPNTPKWQAHGDAEYDFPLTSSFGAFIGASANYHSSSSAAFGGGPLFNISGYTLVDLRAGFQPSGERWRVEVWGRNVTNKYYWNTVERDEDTLTRTTGMPATYGVSLKVRF